MSSAPWPRRIVATSELPNEAENQLCVTSGTGVYLSTPESPAGGQSAAAEPLLPLGVLMFYVQRLALG